MPKLDKKTAKAVAETETQSFDALPADVYIGRLDEVEVRDGAKGPYWSWAFTVVSDKDGEEKFAGRKLWVNTSLSEKAHFKLKEVFDAFGYETDSDTDELIGESIKMLVEETIIEQGARKGQPGNNVVRCMPLDEDGESEGGSDDDEEDVF